MSKIYVWDKLKQYNYCAIYQIVLNNKKYTLYNRWVIQYGRISYQCFRIEKRFIYGYKSFEHYLGIRLTEYDSLEEAKLFLL